MAFRPLSEADLLDLWRTLAPPDYTLPIEFEAFGQGFDLPSSKAVIFARSAEAANVMFQGLYIRPHSTQTAPPASGAARALTTLLVGRLAPAIGAITLVAGTEFQATFRTPTGVTLQGVRFRVIADTLIPGGSLGPIAVDVESSRIGYSNNLPPGSVTSFAARGTAVIPGATIEAGNVLADTAGANQSDRITPAMIGQYVALVGGLNGGTVPRRIISVTQPTVTEPRAFAVLDGAPLLFPDTLTRAEVLEFAELGLTVEQPDVSAGGQDGWLDALGAERNVFRQSGENDEAYRKRIIAIDDVVSPGAIQRAATRILSPLGIPFRIIETRDPLSLIGVVWDYSALDWGAIDSDPMWVFAPATRYFAILVGIGNQGEFGMPYDSPYPSNAYDAPGPALNFYDGSPLVWLAAIQALWVEVNSKRAAGVAFQIFRTTAL